MKIAIVSPFITTLRENVKYYSSQQINLAVALAKQGHFVDIYTTTQENNYSLKQIKVNSYQVKIISLRYIELVPSWPIMIGLNDAIQKNNYDLILSSEDFQLTSLRLALMKNRYKFKLYIYQGNYEYHKKLSWKILMKLYDFCFKSILIKNVNQVICKTPDAERFMIKKGYKRTQVIPIGVDVNKFKPLKNRIKLKKRLFEKYPLLLYVGTLAPRRQPQNLIRTIKILKNDFPDIHLIVIGTGPSKEEFLQEIKDERLEKYISYYERVENSKLNLYYNIADAFLFYSDFEIFGIVLLESMSSGCPVICNNIPAINSLGIDKMGLVIKDLKDLQKIKDYFLNPKELKKKRLTIRKRIVNHFSWEQISEKIIQLFKNTESDFEE